MHNKYFKLFANCIPVNGYKRSIICDLQKLRFSFIPNSLFDILSKTDFVDINATKKLYNNDLIINEYFDFLIKKDFGHYISIEEIALFPKLSLEWHSPSKIINAILDFDNKTNYNVESTIKQLDDLGCKNIQLRFFGLTPLLKITKILNHIAKNSINSIEIILHNNPDIDIMSIHSICDEYPKICDIYIYNSPKFEITKKRTKDQANIIYVIDNIIDENSCGNISYKSFSLNISSFCESQNFNSCLNRKISIDKNGEIKNCPSIKKSYGNINNTLLYDVIKKKEFLELWNICKDEIDTCKVCEFRYICTDCRAYTEDSKNIFSKPEKCSYNPYTATGF